MPAPAPAVKRPRSRGARPSPPEQRDKLADVAVDVMHEMYRAWSIDTLLTWPRKAITLCREVADRLGRRCTEDLEHDVCRSLLNSRKHGDLRRDRN